MEALLSDFVANPSFPCVMAKAVMSKGYVDHQFTDLADPSLAADEILEKIYSFVDHFRASPQTLSSFIVSFEDEQFKDFSKFEQFFWQFLKDLDARDKMKYEPDSRVASEPTAADFSFSLKGEAFFMLVLHPESPRLARKFHTPTVVFNAHQQFEDLRTKGLFHKVRDLIRKRDTALQGFVNPMVKDFGAGSEVFQYTGKVYPAQSKCPFQRAKALFKQALPVTKLH